MRNTSAKFSLVLRINILSEDIKIRSLKKRNPFISVNCNINRTEEVRTVKLWAGVTGRRDNQVCLCRITMQMQKKIKQSGLLFLMFITAVCVNSVTQT